MNYGVLIAETDDHYRTRYQVLLKHQYKPSRLYGITFQKMATFKHVVYQMWLALHVTMSTACIIVLNITYFIPNIPQCTEWLDLMLTIYSPSKCTKNHTWSNLKPFPFSYYNKNTLPHYGCCVTQIESNCLYEGAQLLNYDQRAEMYSSVYRM